jgi:hypothetical protein
VQQRILVISVLAWALLAGALTAAGAQGMTTPPLAAVVSLENLPKEMTTATVDVGGGVTLTLTPLSDRMLQDLTILADGRQVQKIEGSRFVACARLEAGSVTYWAISQYTGGAHCCGQFAFLARPAAGQPVRYLGQTTGYNGGPRDFPGSFIQRQGQVYFESYDNRFDYFHASHADSLLVNVPRYYYLLTPATLKVANIPFKEVYVNEAAGVDQQIHHQATPQDGKPEAILRPGLTPGFATMAFSDNLGQLLVKRTILYLYAREDRKAWDTLKRDVARYYLTDAWVPQLQEEIVQTMQAHPY